MKTMQKIKRASTTTKVALTGNGQGYVQEIGEHLDRFLKDARAFDEAVWDAVMDAKDRTFKVVEVLSPKTKKDSAPWNRLADTWGTMISSGAQLADVFQNRVKKIQSQVGNGSK